MIVFIIILAILIYLAESWSMEHALSGVTYDCQLSEFLLRPDEEFEIITTITNNSPRFVPFIKVEEIFPREIIIKNMELSIREDAKGNIRHVSTCYLSPRSKLVRKISVSISQRGRYIFRGGELKGGDFLGLRENSVQFNLFREVVVYPQETEVADIASFVGGLLGDISVRRFIFEDPILTIGSREYTGKEPMKAISWNHSARTGRLMVKQFDYTIDPAISVILDIEATDTNGLKENLAKRREFCYSAAKTICRMLEERNMKYDFISNAATMDAFSRWAYLNEGSGNRHFSMILEGLGRVLGGNIETLSETIISLVNRQDYDRCAILITVKSPGEHQSETAYFRKKSGGAVYAIEAGDYIK